LGFEPLLLPFSSSDRQVGVLNPVVLPEPARPVQMPQTQLIHSCSVRRQAVGCDRLGVDRLIVQEALQKSERSLCVPPALDHKVQDFAFIIDRPPKVRPLAADPADHLVQVPARRRGPSPLLQPLGDQGAKLDGPAPDRLVADLDPTLRQQLLDVSKTEAEPKVQPHGVAYHVSRKPVALKRNRLHETSSLSAAYAALSGDNLALG
jgi:hypothetical protein